MPKNSPPLPPQIAEPCPKRWEEMDGDGRRRFCEHCQLHVHNLSSLTEKAAARFLAEMREPACLTYQLRADGSMLTAQRWSRLTSPLQHLGWRVAAAFAALLPMLANAEPIRRALGESPAVQRGRVSTAQEQAAQPVPPGKVAPPKATPPPRVTGTPLPPPPHPDKPKK